MTITRIRRGGARRLGLRLPPPRPFGRDMRPFVAVSGDRCWYPGCVTCDPNGTV